MTMEEVEDDAEFGSHFLDSMLEVEMTEEDGEVKISKDEDPIAPMPMSMPLPSTPTFDLQSQTLTYKDVYRNPTVQPVLPNIPMVAPPPPVGKVPIAVPVGAPRPMLTIFSKDVLPGNRLVAVAPQSGPQSPVQRTPIIRKVVNQGKTTDDILGAQFVQLVFSKEYARNVFVKKESKTDPSVVTKEEIDYYKSCFSDVSKVQFFRLHCTICDDHLGCSEEAETKVATHKVLRVLTCKSCHDFYGDGKFPCDKGDNCEIYCRWCAQGGALVCCSFCPRVFCKKCIRQNFGRWFLRAIQKASDWACFCCAQKPLWPHRAVCRALLEFFAQRKRGTVPYREPMKCCPAVLLDYNDKQYHEAAKMNSAPEVTPPPKNRETPLVRAFTEREQAILRSNEKAVSPNKTPPKVEVKVTRLMRAYPGTVVQGTIIGGNNIVRSRNATTTNKLLSSPCPQLIQTPVLHGETLITPPGARLLVTSNTPPTPYPADPSFIKVSVGNQTTDMDLAKIPTAKIPHDVQGLVLRLILPDNRVQLVRLVMDEKTSADIPITNKPPGSIIGANLKEAFHFSKLFRSRLAEVRERVGVAKDTTALEAVVDKLHFVYEKSIELLNELDKGLSKDFQEWKGKRTRKPVDVIELSDEDGNASPGKAKKSRFMEKCKEFVLSDDSDIEILDEVIDKTNKEAKGIVNGDLTEKYRLRGTVIERKKGTAGKVTTRDRNRTKAEASAKAAVVQSSKSSKMGRGRTRRRRYGNVNGV